MSAVRVSVGRGLSISDPWKRGSHLIAAESVAQYAVNRLPVETIAMIGHTAHEVDTLRAAIDHHAVGRRARANRGENREGLRGGSWQIQKNG